MSNWRLLNIPFSSSGTNNRHNENTRDRKNANLFVLILLLIISIDRFSPLEISIHKIITVVVIMSEMMVPFFIMHNPYYPYNGNRHFLLIFIIQISSRTNQHSCNDVNSDCTLLLQYTCDDSLRDGQGTT